MAEVTGLSRAPAGEAGGARSPAEGPLPAREAYRLWAPRFHEETVVSAVEDRTVRNVTPSPAGRSLLDAGCGTGRRLPPPEAGCRRAVGVDLVPEMLAAGPPGDATPSRLVAADLRRLPFRDGLFDLLWCRLVVGHVPDPAGVYRELARVATSGATLVVSDFHPAAVAAGHTRTFRGAGGRLHTVEHHVHTADEQRSAASEAGWRAERVLDAPAGLPERPFYERAGRAAQFDAERDLPLVLVMCFRR